MMCGLSSRMRWLLLVGWLLPLCSLSSVAAEEMYEISETELTMLENNIATLKTHNRELTNSLARARSELARSREELTGARITLGGLMVNLSEARNELSKARNSLTRVQISFDEYERGMKRRVVLVGMGSAVGGSVVGYVVRAIVEVLR